MTGEVLEYQFFTGSDCLTGKQQYANKEAAEEAARAARARGWEQTFKYRCRFCECWHIGNRRSTNSKSRRRR